MKNFVFILFLGCFLGSCSDVDTEKQLANIKNLSSELDSLKMVLQNSTPDTLSNMRMNMMELELNIKQKMVLDTVNLDFASKMDAYKKGSKSIKKINRQFVQLKKTIVEERQTLANLASDVKNGYGKRNKYNDYISTEAQKIKTISKLLIEYKTSIDETMSVYKLLHPQLSALYIEICQPK